MIDIRRERIRLGAREGMANQPPESFRDGRRFERVFVGQLPTKISQTAISSAHRKF